MHRGAVDVGLIDSLLTGAGGPSAADTFTDRVPEAEAFAAMVQSHLVRLSSDPEVGVERARDNVLVFYGLGGLGKTSLSERFEDWMAGSLPDDQDWGAPPDAGERPVLTTRLDMDRHRGFDPERAVLELRATVGSLLERVVTFDLAFAYWWQRVHGDTALPSLPV